MTLQLRRYGDPVLTLATSPIVDFDQAGYLVGVMEPIMREHKGIGLAANQIGISDSLFIFDIGKGLETVVNPEIYAYGDRVDLKEGCLSIPDLYMPIPRFDMIRVRWQDVDGKHHDDEYRMDDDLHRTHVFQHECDHLMGMLIYDTLKPTERKRIKRYLKQRDG